VPGAPVENDGTVAQGSPVVTMGAVVGQGQAGRCGYHFCEAQPALADSAAKTVTIIIRFMSEFSRVKGAVMQRAIGP
jgi:hypothetical protein